MIPIQDIGHRDYITKHAANDPDNVERLHEGAMWGMFRLLSPMIRTGKRLAVKLAVDVQEDVFTRRFVYDHRLQVDEVHERGRVEFAPYSSLPKAKRPAPWHKKLRSFLKQTWDDTGKITGCKL